MGKTQRFKYSKFLVEPGEKFDLAKRSTEAGKELRDKAHGAEELARDVAALQQAQRVLYASNSHSLLVILQGIDAAGKDGTIRHVMGGVNPQGCRVFSFKAPTAAEQERHFLARPVACLPPRGMISLFNRSYYEEVLVVRVHPEFLAAQSLPSVQPSNPKSLEKLWKQRFREIRAFEQALAKQGTIILKFFLHLSKEEQKKRLLARLSDPQKYWKFNASDLAERQRWPAYQHAFAEAIRHTSTKWAPWFAIPADDKWYARAAIANIITEKLESLDLQYPTVPPAELQQFSLFAQQLAEE